MQKSLTGILRMRKSKSAHGKMAEGSASTEEELLPLYCSTILLLVLYRIVQKSLIAIK